MRTNFCRAFQVGAVVAFGLLASSIAQASPEEDFAVAKRSLNLENVPEGLVVMRKLALQNFAPAQAVLGEFLDWSEDDAEAVGWFMLAANQADAEGEYGLGYMYQKGEGIKKDPEKALYWLKRATEKEHNGAMKVMTQAYRLGPAKSGLPQEIDLEKAKALDEKIKRQSELEQKERAAFEERNARVILKDPEIRKILESRGINPDTVKIKSAEPAK